MSGDVPTCSFCAGTVKPDVVFFGEDLPQKYFLHSEDFPKADLLIIMGTSLQVKQKLFCSSWTIRPSCVPRFREGFTDSVCMQCRTNLWNAKEELLLF